MSDRERWVIYPLLLFAFLLAARDKYAVPESAEYNSISCKLLRITSLDGRTVMMLSGAPDESGGRIILHSAPESTQLPGEAPTPGELRGPGYRTVEMGADRDGGYVRIFGARPGLDLHLGHDRETRLSGLLAIDEHEQYVPISGQDATDDAPWGTTIDWTARDDGAGDAGTGEDGSGDGEAGEEPDNGEAGTTASDDTQNSTETSDPPANDEAPEDTVEGTAPVDDKSNS